MGKGAIITIDGPAGAGKSTVGRRLAQSLHYLYLDSGSLYRAVAWQSLRLGLALDDAGALAAMLPDFKPELRADAAGFHLLVDGREVREEIRTPEVSRGSSTVAKLPAVRRWVTGHLRWLARNGGVVADGRDQGTAVFPEAEFKFYLDAALSTRAARRQKDWQPKAGARAHRAALMPVRNAHPTRPLWRRSGRTWPPGIIRTKPGRRRRSECHPGAIVIDTTDLTVDQVVARCLAHIESPN